VRRQWKKTILAFLALNLVRDAFLAVQLIPKAIVVKDAVLAKAKQ
jgi:hypothetical protein